MTGNTQSGPVDEATVRGWLAAGRNVGVRTGACSGVVVIDDDRPKHGLEPFSAPPTELVAESPTGSRHYYYRRFPPGVELRNSTSKLAEKVDVRGEGGYVVVPPSIHPEERSAYRWDSTGAPGVLPDDLLARLHKDGRQFVVDMSEPVRTRRYAQAALERELVLVRAAREGTRNDTLNTAAFNLGQLVAGGELEAESVRAALLAAAADAGLGEHEAAATVTSGLDAGANRPRQKPAPVVPPASPKGQSVLVPGSHNIEGAEYVEQGTHQFAAQVISRLPRGVLYRRGGKVGEVRDGVFVGVSSDRLRTIIDAHVRLVASKQPEDEDNPVEAFRTCTRDHATVLLAYAAVCDGVPELVEVVRAPTLLPDGSVIDRPGFSEEFGVLYQPPSGMRFPAIPAGPTDADARDACARLIAPFAEFPIDDVGRSVLLAFMLTLAARPAVAGPSPGLLVLAPDWAVGKSLIVRAASAAMTGGEPLLSPAPGGRAGDAESEWRKRITTTLLSGARVALIDNVKDGTTLTSEALEAVITASEWYDRLLGGNDPAKLKARTVWAASGVNIALGQALGRRCLRIEMRPQVEDSAARTFEIADLMAHVTQAHPHLVVDALTLLTRYLAIGAPKHGAAPLGSFEAWDALVRGAVVWATQTDPVVSIAAARQSDPQRSALAALLELWERKYPKGATAEQAARDATPGSELLGVLETLEVVDDAGKVSGKLLGYKLREVARRRVGGRRFEKGGTRGGRAFWRVLTDRCDGAGDRGETGGGEPRPTTAAACEAPRNGWDGAPAGSIPPASRPATHLAKTGLGDPASSDFDSSRLDGCDETPLLAGEESGGGERSNTRRSGECGVSSHQSSPEHTRVRPWQGARTGGNDGVERRVESQQSGGVA